MDYVLDVSEVSDVELVGRLEQLVKADRALSVKLLVHLGEMHERRLYVGRGFSSMFKYCMSVLGMSEAEAALRLTAAKVGRRFPLVLERLGAGAVHLTAIKLLAPVLTAENHAQLLERARGKTKPQIELVVAEILQKPDVPARVRKLPDARAPQEALVLVPRESVELVVAPVAPAVLEASSSFVLQSPRARASTSVLRPGRFKLEVTLGQEAHDKLDQLRELLRHQNPNGDLAVIVERALSELLERTMKKRFGQTTAPKQRTARSRPVAKAKGSVRASTRRSRYIPRDVLRAVHARDGGRCTFVSSEGLRCSERGFIEVHHHETFARGGEQTASNLRLACRAHNLFIADQDYGRAFMQRKLREAAGSRTVSEAGATGDPRRAASEPGAGSPRS